MKFHESAFIQPRNVQSTADGHGAAESCVSGSDWAWDLGYRYETRGAFQGPKVQTTGGLDQNHKNIAATGSKYE